jgi:hypothetical protein
MQKGGPVRGADKIAGTHSLWVPCSPSEPSPEYQCGKRPGWKAYERDRGVVRSMAVLLDARGSKSGQTVLIDRGLPAQKLVNGQPIPSAGFIER